MTSATAAVDMMTITINKLEAEVDALKAQLETIKTEVVLVPSFCGSASYTDSDTIYASIAEAKLEEICEKTTAQCLAQVKHDAIMGALKEEIYCGQVEISGLEEYAANLLTQAKDQ